MASRCRRLDIELMGVPCCLALYFSPSLLANSSFNRNAKLFNA